MLDSILKLEDTKVETLPTFWASLHALHFRVIRLVLVWIVKIFVLTCKTYTKFWRNPNNK